MGVQIKSVNVRAKKFYHYNGPKEVGQVHAASEKDAEKLVGNGKAEYVKEKKQEVKPA